MSYVFQIFDGTNITAQQRRDLRDHCVKDLGFRVLFIECICDDNDLMERNIIEILDYSADYKNMKRSEALDDLKNKMKHYTRQYEPIDPVSEEINYIRVENGGESVSAHKLGGPRESMILGFLSNLKPMPQTIYFTRVSKNSDIYQLFSSNLMLHIYFHQTRDKCSVPVENIEFLTLFEYYLVKCHHNCIVNSLAR